MTIINFIFLLILIILVLIYTTDMGATMTTATGGSSGNSHTITVQEPWFSAIKNGDKRVEGRLQKGIFTKLRVGDTVHWKNPHSGEQTATIVSNLKIYDSFRDMLETEGVHKVLPRPEIKTLHDGVAVYDRFFPKELQEKHKVVAVHLT